MNKKARDLKKGDKIKIAGKVCTIEEIEISDVAGKGAMTNLQGKRKVRIEAETTEGEKIVVIRPDEYPFELEK